MATTVTDRLGSTFTSTGSATPNAEASAGLAIKQAVRVASTGNLGLSGLSTIDGIALASSDRVLAKNQTDVTENGVYVASSGSWSRSNDFNADNDVAKGMLVYVSTGAASGRKTFALSAGSTIDGSTISFEDSRPKVPAFSAHLNSTNQTGIVDATPTAISFNNEVYDVGSHFSTGTGTWTPPAGIISLTGSAVLSGTWVPGSLIGAYIIKNSSTVNLALNYAASSDNGAVQISVMDKANGTDTYRFAVSADLTSTAVTATAIGVPTQTWFMGSWLGPAS